MPSTSNPDIRATLLTVIEERIPTGPSDSPLQTNSVLQETAERIGAKTDITLQQALLTKFHDLFRTE